MELQETLNLVKTNWKQQGLNLIELRSKDKLIKILSKFNILASEEFMEVYSIINGFDENDMDSEGLSFWPIEKILRGNKPNDEYIYFADFLINSHWYGYKNKWPNNSMICIHYSESERPKVADSFNEFFELYLKNQMKLFI
jgi:hypothetical protein